MSLSMAFCATKYEINEKTQFQTGEVICVYGKVKSVDSIVLLSGKGGGLESCSADTKDKPTTYDQTANRQVKAEDSQGKFFEENQNE